MYHCRLCVYRELMDFCLPFQFTFCPQRSSISTSSCDAPHWLTPPPRSQRDHENLMWDPIKWFVRQGSYGTSLPALYKNSPPNLGARSSGDRGQSQFRFSAVSHPPPSAPPLHRFLTWHALVRAWRGCTRGFQTGDKWGIKAPAWGRGDAIIWTQACRQTPDWQHFKMVRVQLTRVSLSGPNFSVLNGQT